MIAASLWAGERSREWSQVENKGHWSLMPQGRLSEQLGPWSLPELLLWGCGLDGSEGWGTPLAQTLWGPRCYSQTCGCKGEASVDQM